MADSRLSLDVLKATSMMVCHSRRSLLPIHRLTIHFQETVSPMPVSRSSLAKSMLFARTPSSRSSLTTSSLSVLKVP